MTIGAIAAGLATWSLQSRLDDPEPVPAEYAGLSAANASSVRGEALFVENCAPCHGTSGLGDGPASRGLEPEPAPLSEGGFLSRRSDAYLFWRISEGKSGTAMPSFRDTLSAEDRLAIVRYLRDGLILTRRVPPTTSREGERR